MLRAIVDPNIAPLRTAPRNERDLVISGSNSLMLVLDNMSQLPEWLSDALCRLATGGGMSTRELYADRDEALFQLRRPIISMASKNLLLEATCLIVPSFSTYRASPPNVAKQNGSSGVNSSSHTQESWERWCPLFPLQSGPTSTSRFHRYREWLISCDGLSQRNRPWA